MLVGHLRSWRCCYRACLCCRGWRWVSRSGQCHAMSRESRTENHTVSGFPERIDGTFLFCMCRTYAVALFRVTTPCFLPAAAWYVPILCVPFCRATRGKTAHNRKEEYRSAEGSTRQL